MLENSWLQRYNDDTRFLRILSGGTGLFQERKHLLEDTMPNQYNAEQRIHDMRVQYFVM